MWPLPSPIPPCSTAARGGRRSHVLHRSPMSRRRRAPRRCICRAAIPSCTRHVSQPIVDPRRCARGSGPGRLRPRRVRRLHGARPELGRPAGAGPRHGGLLPVTSSFAEPRCISATDACAYWPSPLGQAGTTYRGHEFLRAPARRRRCRRCSTSPTRTTKRPPRSALRSAPQPAHSCI